MAESSGKAVLYTAIYNDADTAQADLDAFEELHRNKIIGTYDAAVIDYEDGRPHIVKRADHPGYRVIPEWLGSGTLPRRELHDAAQGLGPGEAALIVVGEPTLDQAFEKAVSRSAKTLKREINATTDELSKELIEAAKQ